jgi:signal transduction histidine kinase
LGFVAAIVLVATAYINTRSAYARRRIRLIVIGTALGFSPFALLTAIWGQVSMRFTFPFMLIIPIAYGIALWRHSLMGFDRVIRRGVVYVLVSGLLFGVYFAALALLNTVLPTDTVWRAILGAASALVAAATLRPLRDRVQRLVDRLFYGGWYDYRTLVEDVGQTLAHTLDQETLAHVLVQQVPQAMHLRGACLLLERNGEMATIAKHGDVTAISPSPTDSVEMSSSHAQVPLVVEDQTVGLWILTGRPVEGWGPEDESILTALGQQAALAAQNVHLIAELRAKMAEVEGMHQRLLAAREEERADLARELHDSTIQDMIGLRYRLEALQDGESEPVEALHTRIGQMIGELRRLCSDLRPPMLDQLGLAAALQALAREVSDRGLPVDAHLEDLSLSDEAAIGLYRICQEALSNALRHAEATRATVTLSHEDDEITLTITDDGGGFSPLQLQGQTGSFGLLGMAERAEGLGGRLEIESSPDSGTRVTVQCACS